MSARNRERMTVAHNWSEKEIVFLRSNYPKHGAVWVGQKLGLDKYIVRDKANRLKLRLNKKTMRKLVHDIAAKFMRAHNPSKRPGATEYLRRNSSTPEHIAIAFQACLKNQRDRPSGLEKKLWKILDSFGVVYQKQVAVKPHFIIDVTIGRLVIEADGDWWHGHQRFKPLNERQVKQKARDKARNAYLTKCGYAVERIWESDMNPETVRAILIKHNVILI